jgi:hypothetical protein
VKIKPAIQQKYRKRGMLSGHDEFVSAGDMYHYSNFD